MSPSASPLLASEAFSDYPQSVMHSFERLGPDEPPQLPADWVAARTGRFHDWQCSGCQVHNPVFLVACRDCHAEGTAPCLWQGCGLTSTRAALVVHMSKSHARPQAEKQRKERSEHKQFHCLWVEAQTGRVCGRTFVKEAELESHFAAHTHTPGIFCPTCVPYYFLNEEDHRRHHTPACDPVQVQGPRPIHRRRHHHQQQHQQHHYHHPYDYDQSTQQHSPQLMRLHPSPGGKRKSPSSSPVSSPLSPEQVYPHHAHKRTAIDLPEGPYDSDDQQQHLLIQRRPSAAVHIMSIGSVSVKDDPEPQLVPMGLSPPRNPLEWLCLAASLEQPGIVDSPPGRPPIGM